MSDPNNPFKIILQEKLNASKNPIQFKSDEESTGWKIVKYILIGLLILFLIILLGLVIWALTVAYKAKNEADSIAQNTPSGSSTPGPQGCQGPMGPQGPPGTFYFVGLGAVSGIYVNGCVKIPTENKIVIPSSDYGTLVFDKRLPDTGKITDNQGNIFIGQDGVYVVYATLDFNINSNCDPVIVRVYKNNIMFGYYEYFQSGSQSFTFANNYKAGDQIRISVCTEADNNELITHGSFVSILGS